MADNGDDDEAGGFEADEEDGSLEVDGGLGADDDDAGGLEVDNGVIGGLGAGNDDGGEVGILTLGDLIGESCVGSTNDGKGVFCFFFTSLVGSNLGGFCAGVLTDGGRGLGIE